MSRRRLWVLTSTRADYGLLYWLLREIDGDDDLELQLAVTGSHLSAEFGETVKDIERDGFHVYRRMEILLSSDTRIAMTKAMGLAMLSCGEALAEDRPDMVVLLGDRFEIVPVALAAVTHGVPVAHLHGGETSRGALDDYFRHAVTKLASLHFPATETYRRRILQMGESPERVYNYGAPGLDHLHRSEPVSREALSEVLELSLDRPTAIVTYHPVTIESDRATASPVSALLAALDARPDLQVVFSKANADARGRAINTVLAQWCEAHPERSRLFDNLGQRLYHACLHHLDLMIGNSSSGLVEAPSFRLPVVNVGSRQEGRLLADNVISVADTVAAISQGIGQALDPAFQASIAEMSNPYDHFGDGSASRRIKDVLKQIPLDVALMKKGFVDMPGIAAHD
ncbi:UDP-N-acetylglucosamine 2-epimerase [Aidingimonas lacisalsi]|uniref:UDP-N-acetylglucosamine 2-epimerase n=1 Tax=Aidingimonas lacisalsi TaxID=2604086 RepID=UPI0011D204CD|nr:UDP-N-acetylglucosamine 2-epimerase [Aidingimonas lacisalsi]